MTYRKRYGYPWRWAILVELAWRLEHTPGFRVRGYRWRKAAERNGARQSRYCPDCGGVLSPDWPALRELEAEIGRLRSKL